jgi:hypothetical protein
VPNIFEGGRYGFGLMLFQSRGLQVADTQDRWWLSRRSFEWWPAHRFGVIALANGEVPAIRTVDAAMETLLPLRWKNMRTATHLFCRW